MGTKQLSLFGESEGKITQKQAVLNHLKTKGPITPLVALNTYGCFRLASIIHRLKKEVGEEGYYIESVPTNNGGKTFSTYFLKPI